MKKFLDKIFEKSEKIIFYLFIFLLIYFSFTLFINNFNILKVLIFFGLIFVSLTFSLFLYFLKLPRKEKISFFLTFQNLLDYLNEGVVIYDNDFKIVFANKAFAKISGLKKEELINLIISQGMIKNEKYEMLANLFFPFLQGEDLKIISKDPEVIEVSFSKPKEKYFLIEYFNIFLEKPYKLRVILDKTEDVLESRKKIEFVRLISHNLLTPLNQLRWAIEAIDLKKVGEENKTFLESALSIIKNTLGFVEGIFTFLKVESGKLKLRIEDLDLERIFLDILDILKSKIEEKGLKVNIEITQGEEKIPGDRSLIFATLFSLVENAVIYNKTGGSIDIFIRRQPQRPYREIIIKDSGIGMSKEDLENLFKKYYRGEKAKELDIKGFGLGLYNAKTIINLHGGEIKVESKEGLGTTVTIILPLDVNLIPK